jgi:hypothetical protein
MIKTALSWLIGLAIASGIGGYLYWANLNSTQHDEKSKVKREAQTAKAAILMRGGPRVTQHATELGELLTIEIPEKAIGSIVFFRKCYVWNNKATLASAMSCENSGSPSLQDKEE